MLKSFKVGAVAVALLGTTLAAPALAQEAPTVETPAGPEQGRFNGPFMEIITEFLGVSKGEVISNWATGNTLADLAEANGSSGEALVDELLAYVEEHLDRAVANGRITEEEAAEYLANAERRINHLVFEAHKGPGKPGVGGEFRQSLIDVIEEELGVTQGEIVSQMRTGGTLAELAEENGSSGEELVAALYAWVEEKVEAAVGAGQMTPERGEAILDKALERLTNLVFNVHKPGRGPM